MVLINNKKYACETCIKGHRSSSCNHTDRPLSEIKRKGRPITQCQHCRELRKSKQVHVKCICGTDKPAAENQIAGPSSLSGSSAPSIRIQEASPAYTAAVISGTTVCCCGSAEDCKCCIPRRIASKAQKNPSVALDSRTKTITEADYEFARKKDSRLKRILPKASVPANLISRIAGFRPLFPKPPKREGIDGVSIRDLGLHPRPQHHSPSYNSPYHRAYEHTRDLSGSDPNQDQIYPALERSLTITRPESQASSGQSSEAGSSSLSDRYVASTCGCVDNCSCAGCSAHSSGGSYRGAAAYAACTNPGSCTGCFDCMILSMPNDVPFVAPFEEFSAEQTDFIDNWARQVSTTIPNPTATNLEDGSFQDWDGVVPPDQVDPISYFQPPIQQDNSFSYPDNPSFDALPDTVTSYLPTPGAPYLSQEEEDLSQVFANMAGLVPDAQGSYLSQQNMDIQPMFFNGTNFSAPASTYRSLSPFSSSSQSSLFSSPSPVGAMGGAWNSQVSVVDSVNSPQGNREFTQSPYFSDSYSSGSNCSSSSVHDHYPNAGNDHRGFSG